MAVIIDNPNKGKLSTDKQPQSKESKDLDNMKLRPVFLLSIVTHELANLRRFDELESMQRIDRAVRLVNVLYKVFEALGKEPVCCTIADDNLVHICECEQCELARAAVPHT